MFYENEKDILNNNADIHVSEDGVVSWDGDIDGLVLDESSDDSNSSNITSDTIPSDDSLLGFSDELELVNNDDNDDSDLNKILSSEESGDDSSGNSSMDEFDIDKQLENASKDASDDTEPIGLHQRKNQVKKGSSVSPVILGGAAIFILVLVGAVVYLPMYLEDNDMSFNDLIGSKQEAEITKDTLEQRQENTNQNQEQNQDVPIVNENNANQLQPEAQEQEEKTEVVDIKPEGRTNPFLPMQKYIAYTPKPPKVENVPDTYINYAKVNIPKPPTVYPQQNENVFKMRNISVSGIMYDSIKPSAIISFDGSDYFVQAGDKLEEFLVVEIGRNYVTIAIGKNRYKANVGEQFKIDNIDGSAKYITGNPYGPKQYYFAKGSSNDNHSNSGSMTNENLHNPRRMVEVNAE